MKNLHNETLQSAVNAIASSRRRFNNNIILYDGSTANNSLCLIRGTRSTDLPSIALDRRGGRKDILNTENRRGSMCFIVPIARSRARSNVLTVDSSHEDLISGFGLKTRHYMINIV